jgi:hypothetical protein
MRGSVEAGSGHARTSKKDSPPWSSKSLSMLAILAWRQLDDEHGRRGEVEDEVEDRYCGPRHSWPITSIAPTGSLHVTRTREQGGEWHRRCAHAGRPEKAMPCAETAACVRAAFEHARQVLTSHMHHEMLISPLRVRRCRHRPPRWRRREEASPAMVRPRITKESR